MPNLLQTLQNENIIVWVCVWVWLWVLLWLWAWVKVWTQLCDWKLSIQIYGVNCQPLNHHLPTVHCLERMWKIHMRRVRSLWNTFRRSRRWGNAKLFRRTGTTCSRRWRNSNGIGRLHKVKKVKRSKLRKTNIYDGVNLLKGLHAMKDQNLRSRMLRRSPAGSSESEENQEICECKEKQDI